MPGTMARMADAAKPTGGVVVHPAGGAGAPFRRAARAVGPGRSLRYSERWICCACCRCRCRSGRVCAAQRFSSALSPFCE